MSFTNVAAPLTGQDFLMVPTIAPLLSSTVNGDTFNLTWAGLSGVSYQAWWSTNLTDWLPLGDLLPGTNGPMQLTAPVGDQPIQFFRIQANN